MGPLNIFRVSQVYLLPLSVSFIVKDKGLFVLPLTFLVLRLLVFHNTRIQETLFKRINDSLETCLILRKSVFVVLCIQRQVPFVLKKTP